jgi:hypothetical protein
MLSDPNNRLCANAGITGLGPHPLRTEAFRKHFVRGAEATPPCYVATNEQIADLVKSRSHQSAFDV